MAHITWIISTGSSDIQICNESAWKPLFLPKKSEFGFDCKPTPNKKQSTNSQKRCLIPSRILGMIADHAGKYEKLNLDFPLLDGFTCHLENKEIRPNRIILYLTDQGDFFQGKQSENSPYWQDTCETKAMFRWYFKKKAYFEYLTDEDLIFKSLAPCEFGLSDWDKTLPFLQKSFQEIISNENDLFYVSHQAGTPAISSAIQFISLNQFGKNVNFLVSNEFDPDNTQILESSEYLKYLFVGQAKELLKKGNPAATLQLLKGLVHEDVLAEITKQVKKFNLKPESIDQNDEFEPIAAAERVRDVLDLIEIFLGNENYLEAIALLAAAHETFLKAAIIYLLDIRKKSLYDDKKYKFLRRTIAWNKEGLCFKAYPIKGNIIKNKLLLSRSLFKSYRRNKQSYFKPNNTNSLQWLKILLRLQYQLKSKDWVWGNLKWTMKYIREYDDDLRNQLMHNLRGVEKADLIDYLKGKDTRDRQNELEKPEDVFKSAIKTQFVSVMSKIFFKADGTLAVPNEIENHIQNKLDSLAKSLDKSLTPENSQ